MIFFIPCPTLNFGNGIIYSRYQLFPGMIASDSCSQNVGMDFFIPFPFLKFGNVFFHSLPVPELREWVFSIPFPFPNFGNGIIHSRSRSRTPKCHSRSPLPKIIWVRFLTKNTIVANQYRQTAGVSGNDIWEFGNGNGN